MRFPQETVVQTFLPTYRSLLAKALAREGLPQEQIAALIGVTQAQVSKYLTGKIDHEPTLADDPRVTRTIDAIAPPLAEGRIDTVTALARSLALIRTLENRGPLCQIHTENMPALEGTGCDACIDPESSTLNEHRTLVDVRYALRRLLNIEGLADWIPHVGSNLAQATKDATDVWDVAALPGRIDAIGGQPRASTEPQMGASQHVATVVLAVHDAHPDHRAALNITYREPLLGHAESAGYATVRFDADYEGRRDEVTRRINRTTPEEAPPILYHEGAFGIEPVAYILGHDAEHVVERTSLLMGQAERSHT